MKRINLTFSDGHFKKIVQNAKAADVKPGTWCKLAAMSAAGIEIIEPFTMPKKIKQLNLFGDKNT